MAEIVEEISKAFENDPDIDELGMVLSSDESIVLVEHKLGISMASLKPLFKYSITELQKLRHVLLKPADLVDPTEAKRICDLSRATLLVKGDFPPALNARKVMIVHGILSAKREIKFLNVIFSKHPKSPSAWHHRRWCLLRLFLGTKASSRTCPNSSNSSIPAEERVKDSETSSFSTVVANEVALCEQMCDLYPRNYYSWNHRLWLAQQMDSIHQLEDEYNKISIWLKRHVSDHSAIHHQHQVVLLLLKVASTSYSPSTMESASGFDPARYSIQLLEKILCESMQVLHSSGAGGHMSLWGLRRLWVQTLLSVLPVPPPLDHQQKKQVFGREEQECTKKRNQGRKQHGFNVCFGAQYNHLLQDNVTESSSHGPAVDSVINNEHNCSEKILYFASVQRKALNRIIENFNEVKNADVVDSYIGLSLSDHVGRVSFSAIEVALDLPQLLEDGVTYRLNMPGTNPSSDRGVGAMVEVASIEEEMEEDEVTASLRMHSARLTSLLQQLPTITLPQIAEGYSNSSAIVNWLFQFLTEEVLFCGTCISTSGWYTSNCWDPKKQKQCALEYIIFLNYQVLHFLKANGMEVPVAGQRGEEGTYVGSSSALVMNNLTALAHLSCQRYFEDGLGLCAGKMKTILRYGTGNEM